MSKGDFVALTRCFLCGEGKDLLISTRLHDISPLHDKVHDTEPCPKCKDLMKEGIILISVREPKNETEKKNPYRTGGFWCVREEPLRRIFTQDADVFRTRVAFIPNDLARNIGLPGVEKLSE